MAKRRVIILRRRREEAREVCRGRKGVVFIVAGEKMVSDPFIP